MSMATVERFTPWRQRHALIALAEHVKFLDTPEGFAFIEQLHTFHTRSMVKLSHSWGWPLDKEEIVNTTIEHLCRDGGKVAELASQAADPWAYIGKCQVGWVREQWGTKAVRLDGFEEWLPAPAMYHTSEELTPLGEVVDASFQVLAEFTPLDLHPALLRLLGWLAANPIQRLSYEVDEKQAMHRFCPEMTIGQVTAVMKITWGARPRQAETSTMRAL
ncbi:MAG: hypothetical protein GX862_07570, partial [Leucobacter sp.]|nr:hypothetical protein [Leucobacter sp.]